ncbi:MAG: preprotein translocase subunit SecA [Bacteroidales bacterium]|jgi:preprotein translocase subunit SecA|nr:preprotein translocase subunit SecA [Bacteroidales bacterium]MDD2264004.1 preprotein translocase subunit SecA [Bacteroidales bacterium]MDD2831238.1 preprotein translocase subunit SecA [Bacteroidales bacterium]MDD3208649.1 preprotein translocase subunit SecA [Bacteroidales bacterium]MDD3697212.1 preprotein translocase subunit SecA [Bacteroidales bacterium]
MASFINVIGKIFGSKADRDLKQLTPDLEKIKKEYERIDKLDHDDLRAETQKIREIILEYTAEDEKQKAALRKQLEDVEIEIDKKEELATEVDKLTKKIDEKIEEVLERMLPQAFAIMKSTARRFQENETLTVTATDFDRQLSTHKDHMEIRGDKAVWHNSWMAGGNMITWDMVHYDVQLIGGVVLHQGKIAEMATGEGKTLVATLPVFLNALAGKGVHIVTVNDYLSKRDSEWMGPLYEFHGLKVDCIDKHQPNSEERKKAYRADITFGTNNEFGFDYLRDNMAINSEDLVQRKHHYAIVDEVDSVLIDDARTPLIISGPVAKGEDQQFNEFRPIVEQLYQAQRSLVQQHLADARKMISEGDEENGAKLLLRAYKGLPKYTPLIKYLSEQGIKQLLQKTENFYMQDNNKQMHLITDDLYFVIEEQQKSVDLTEKGHDLIAKKVSDPAFFILPDMGTEISELEKKNLTPEEKAAAKDALLSEYAVKSERVHTVNQLLKAYAMFDKDVEYIVVDNKIKIVDEQTGRVLEGRRYSDGLHQAIEAKERVKVEAATQTFATITLQNYFRMYHKLAGMTGTAETEAGEFWSIYKLDVVVIPTNRPIIRIDGDDLIYKTKREKFNAVIDKINELTKAGRPVLVGTTSVEVSELLSRMLKMRSIKHNVLNAKQHAREAEIVAEAGRAGSVTIATNMAGRGTDIKLREGVREAGGLAIIGTERHDSRRVDRQLRGRAGRQGDPGSSNFYVSLEDDLMRLFGSGRIASVVDKMGMKEGEVLQHSMLSSSIERAQKKVEENNFGIRKRLLEYDDVMNSQREVIYTRRRNALYGERVDVDVANMMSDFAASFVQQMDGVDYDDFSYELIRMISIEPGFDQETFNKSNTEELATILSEQIQKAYARRAETLVAQAWPIMKNIYETQRATYENVVVPVGDGKRIYQVIVNIKKAYESKGKELIRAINKTINLVMIDEFWKEHLRDMDDLKQSVQNATYEQKDPLLVYKFESFKLFSEMLERIAREVLSFLLKAHIPLRRNQDRLDKAGSERSRTDLSNTQTSRPDMLTQSAEPRSNAPVHVEKQVGRNDPCPCGSGKKYKHCHGKNQ